MEGSRHEKATLLILSYVIGFVTAAILFGVSLPGFNNEMAGEIAEPSEVNNRATAIESFQSGAFTAADERKTEIPPENKFKISYENGLLEVEANRNTDLLSFNPDINSDTQFDFSSPQGFHFGNIVFKVSSDDSFVFFCERQDIKAETCYGFVYDVKADRIYPVIKDGEVALISDQSSAEAIWTVLGLKVGSNYSANASAPWVLIDAN